MITGRDSKDNHFLELAVEAGAAGIIFGDDELSELYPFRKSLIVMAVYFI